MTMRVFAAIKPPPSIIRKLVLLQKGVEDARWSDPDKLHITLGFFGDVANEKIEILDYELVQHGRTGFDVALSGAGHFGNKEPHAIWIGVDMSKDLRGLYKHCRRAARHAKIEMESRKFMPHVTLAYLKDGTPHAHIIAFEKRLAEFKLGPFLVDQFFLISSHQRKSGSNLYRVEASYPLLG